MRGAKMAVEVTDMAIKQFKKILGISDKRKSTMRVSLSGGCCYTFYGLETREKGEDGDILVEKANLNIYLDPAMFEGFSATAIDYKDSLLAIVGEHGNSLATGPLINMKGGKS